MIRDIFALQNPWRGNLRHQFKLKPRAVFETLLRNLSNDKIIGLIGSRQVGKSSLLYLIIEDLLNSGISGDKIFYFNLDDLKLHELFHSLPDFIHFIGETAKQKYIFIDEVQRLPNPGLFLKEVHDLKLNLKVFYSGSSQLEVKTNLKENLVGRARQFEIRGLSFSEHMKFSEPTTRRASLESMLLFGAYPGVVLEKNAVEKKLNIKDIYQSYVEKDLTDFLKVDNVNAFNRVVGLLANQIGALLNIESLARTARLPRTAVENYLSILEHTFVIRRIFPFFRNYGKEITKTPKIYFLDLGLRNFVMSNFTELDFRSDTGKLFENFYLLELLNQDPHGLQRVNFWRTTNQTEIDFMVSREGQRKAIEVKWESTATPKSFATIKKYYPDIETTLVNRLNFL